VHHLQHISYTLSAILAYGAIKPSVSAAQKLDLLPGLMDGTAQAALAFVEEQSRFGLAMSK
jgi:hypothetical protein